MRQLLVAALLTTGLVFPALAGDRNAAPPAWRETTRPAPPPERWKPRKQTLRGAGPVAGDWPQGWPVGRNVLAPDDVTSIPWLRSATAARAFAQALPEDDERARQRLAGAMAMIVARHGFRFEEPQWRDAFARERWYVPSRHYTPDRLMPGERQALAVLTLELERR